MTSLVVVPLSVGTRHPTPTTAAGVTLTRIDLAPAENYLDINVSAGANLARIDLAPAEKFPVPISFTDGVVRYNLYTNFEPYDANQPLSASPVNVLNRNLHKDGKAFEAPSNTLFINLAKELTAYKTRVVLDTYKPEVFVPPTNDLLTSPAVEAIAGTHLVVKWDNTLTQPDAWRIKIGKSPLGSEFGVEDFVGGYEHTVTGYPSDGTPFSVTLFSVTGGVESYVSYRTTSFDVADSLKIFTPSQTLYDDDEEVTFIVPDFVGVTNLEVTDQDNNVVQTLQSLTPKTTYTFTDLPSSVTQVTMKLSALSSGTESYSLLSLLYNATAPAVITNSGQLDSNKAVIGWTTPGWTDAISWSLKIGTTAGGSDIAYENTISGDKRSFDYIKVPPTDSPVFVTLQWLRDTGTQLVTKELKSATLNLHKASGGALLDGVTELMKWNSMPDMDKYRLKAFEGTNLLFDSGHIFNRDGEMLVTGLPRGTVTPIRFELTHYFESAITVVNKEYNPSASLILNTPTVPIKGNAALFKWALPTGIYENVQLVVSGQSGAEELPNTATSYWMYNLDKLPSPITVSLVTIKDGVSTTAQTETFTVQSEGVTLDSPDAIVSSSATLDWSGGLAVSKKLAPLNAQYAAILSEIDVGTAVTATITPLPASQELLHFRLSRSVDSTRHATVFDILKTNVFVKLSEDPYVFTGSSQLLRWAILTSEATVNTQVKIIDPSTGFVYYDSGVLVDGVDTFQYNSETIPGYPNTRVVSVTGLPANGQGLTISVATETASGENVIHTFPATAYLASSITPTMTPASGELPLQVIPVRVYDNGSNLTEVVLRVRGSVASIPLLTLTNTTQGVYFLFNLDLPILPPVIYVEAICTSASGEVTTLNSILSTQVARAALLPVISVTPTVFKNNRNRLASRTATYSWTSPTGNESDWRLRIRRGNILVHDGTVLPASTLTETVTTHADKGEAITVTLFYTVNGEPKLVTLPHYEYIAIPTILNPNGILIAEGPQTVDFDMDSILAASIRIQVLKDGTVQNQTFLQGTDTSAQLPTLIIDGSPTVVRLSYKRAGESDYTSIYRTYETLRDPSILEDRVYLHTYGTLIPWSANGSDITEYSVTLGTAAGLSDIADTGALPSTVFSHLFANVPFDGSDVFATLHWTKADGSTGSQTKDIGSLLLAPAFDQQVAPFLDTRTTSWKPNGVIVTDWKLDVGTTQGGTDIMNGDWLPANTLSAQVVIPHTLGTAYYTLSYKQQGDTNTVFTTSSEHIMLYNLKILSPAEGGRLTADNFILALDSGNNPDVTKWRYKVNGPGTNDNFYDSKELTNFNPSNVITGMPVDGSPLTIEAGYYNAVTDTWEYVYRTVYAYQKDPFITTEFVDGGSGFVNIQIPNINQEFTWSGGDTNVTQYEITMGSSKGTDDIYHSPVLSSSTLAHTITGIPTDGRDVYVTLIWETP